VVPAVSRSGRLGVLTGLALLAMAAGGCATGSPLSPDVTLPDGASDGIHLPDGPPLNRDALPHLDRADAPNEGDLPVGPDGGNDGPGQGDAADAGADPATDLPVAPDLPPPPDIPIDRGPAPTVVSVAGAARLPSGQTATYTVTLSGPARLGGEQVTMTSSDPLAGTLQPGDRSTLPILIAEGNTTGTVPLKASTATNAVGRQTTVQADLEGSTASTDVVITAAAGTVVITEILPIAGPGLGEFVEVLNKGAVSLDLSVFTLASSTSGPQPIAKVGGGAFTIAPGARAVLVPSGGGQGLTPDGTYGPSGAGFSLGDAGDVLTLKDDAGTVQDMVDFRRLVTDTGTTLTAGDYPAMRGVSMQVDPTHENAIDNDVGANFCLSFGVAHTAGAPNQDCGRIRLQEVLIDATGADDGKVFIELSGPGGGPVGGLDIRRVNASSGASTLVATVTAGGRLRTGGVWLLADLTNTAPSTTSITGADQTDVDVDALGNAGGGVQLVKAGTLLDALGYGAITATSASNNLAFFEGTPAALAPAGQSLSRNAQSSDTGNNAVDFTAGTPTPGTR
jgi:hypothetical protein